MGLYGKVATCGEYVMWRSRTVEESSRLCLYDAQPCCWQIEPEISLIWQVKSYGFAFRHVIEMYQWLCPVLTSSCFLLCRWCRGLFFKTSSPWIISFSNLVNLVSHISSESVLGHSGACQPPLLLLHPRHPSQCSAEAFPPAHRDRWAGWQRRRTSRGPKASSLSGACRTSRWSACCFPGVA